MGNTTSLTLLERLRSGTDPVPWEEFFQRYWRLIFAYARRFGCSEHTAEEIVQEFMTRLFEKREVFRFDSARGSFRNWLGTVVRNLVAARRRSPSEAARAFGGEAETGREEPAADDPLPDDVAQAMFEQSLLAVLIDVVRGEFNGRWFQAFELTALAGMPAHRVAQLTGLSRAAVYQARSRVLARLRELGAPYRKEGRLSEQVRRALDALPEAAVQQSLSVSIGQTMRSRSEARS